MDHTLKSTQSHFQVMVFVQLWIFFHLPSTLLICCHVHVLPKRRHSFGGCGWFLPFIIKRVLGIKHIFTCSFGNKRIHLLIRVYSISSMVKSIRGKWTVCCKEAVRFSEGPLLEVLLCSFCLLNLSQNTPAWRRSLRIKTSLHCLMMKFVQSKTVNYSY